MVCATKQEFAVLLCLNRQLTTEKITSQRNITFDAYAKSDMATSRINFNHI